MAAYYVGFSLIWFGSIVGFVIIGHLARDWTAARVGGVLVALLVALVPALVTALLPYDATLSDEGVCEFRSLLRRRRVRVPQIRSIKSDEDYIYIRYDRGKVHVLTVSDVKDLLIRLLELNPAIELDDWLRHELEEVASAAGASENG